MNALLLQKLMDALIAQRVEDREITHQSTPAHASAPDSYDGVPTLWVLRYTVRGTTQEKHHCVIRSYRFHESAGAPAGYSIEHQEYGLEELKARPERFPAAFHIAVREWRERAANRARSVSRKR